MSTRYLSNLALTLAASFLVVATQAFSLSTVMWLTFALAIAFTVVGLYMVALERTVVQRIIGGLTGVIGAWTIVASLVFGLVTVQWLGFAAAVALVGLGVIGMTVHELTTERVVHSLQVEREPVANHRRVASGEPIAA
jgi:hypothetical protein